MINSLQRLTFTYLLLLNMERTDTLRTSAQERDGCPPTSLTIAPNFFLPQSKMKICFYLGEHLGSSVPQHALLFLSKFPISSVSEPPASTLMLIWGLSSISSKFRSNELVIRREKNINFMIFSGLVSSQSKIC